MSRAAPTPLPAIAFRRCGLVLAWACWRVCSGETPAETVDLTPPGEGSPEAIAVLDGDPGLGRWVALSGELTRDPEGKPPGYAWAQLQGPPLANFAEQASLARVWVHLARPGGYRFALRARNAKGWSAPAKLDFDVADGKPALPPDEAFARAGAGEKFVFPGEGWRQLAGPKAALQLKPDATETVFRPLQAGLYLFEALHAGDVPERRGILVPPGRDALMGDRRPRVELPPSFEGRACQPLRVDGARASDPDGLDEPLQARWAIAEGPELKLVETAGLKATFLAPREGMYKVSLIVSDGKLDSEPAETFLNVAAADSAAAADISTPSKDPLEAPVSLNLYESHLQRAVDKLPGVCGVTLRVDMDWTPPERLRLVPLHLGVREAPVRLLADWIARQTGAVYRREAENSLWLTTPGSFKDEKLEGVALAVDALYQAPDASDLKAFLNGIFQPVLAGCPGASLEVQPESQKAVGVLPASAARRLKELLLHLRAPKGWGLPPPSEPAPAARALRQTLGARSVSLNAERRRLDWLLKDLAEAGGLPCGFQPRGNSGWAAGDAEALGRLPRITLKLDRVPLRQAVREIVEAGGFDGCQAQAEGNGGLWFYYGGEPYPSGERLWDVAEVRAYDLATVLARLPLLSGEAVAWQIRRRVYPPSWKDPAACCAYHAPTGKLVVVHGERGHEKVLALLHDLLARGEAALGPVEYKVEGGK